MSEGPAFDGKAFVRLLGHEPGVYRMLDARGRVLYVGKAADLKKRVSSYFSSRRHSPRIRSMLAQVASMEVDVTPTEGEALLLENRLIKSLKPRYNILLRDDKSFPSIRLSTGHAWPGLAYHRGAKKPGNHYFGPFPSVKAVRHTLDVLQKLFRLRQCEDSQLENRSRPCLQYQIGRCLGPCAGCCTQEQYAEAVEHTRLFLQGKSLQVIEILGERMEAASRRLEFEQAAHYRDLIASLKAVQHQQFVDGVQGDLDVLGAWCEGGQACVHHIVIRHGQNLGSRNHFPRVPADTRPEELLAGFLPQFYARQPVPPRILLSHEPEGAEHLSQWLGQLRGGPVRLVLRPRGERARLLEMARDNARHAVALRLASATGVQQRMQALQQALGLEEPPERVECFDISHTQGSQTVASCVVFGPEGPVKTAWRRFNIRDITPGDDYAAMRQALLRHYRRLLEEGDPLPELLLIDGGTGQVKQASEVLRELQIESVQVLGVAKGPARKAGEEVLVPASGKPFRLPATSPALHLIQQIRDEAHRFAIEGHRQRRQKQGRYSVLEDIPGVGPARRAALLKHFGGLQGLMRAGEDDLLRVPGLNRKLAGRIVAHLRRLKLEKG